MSRSPPPLSSPSSRPQRSPAEAIQPIIWLVRKKKKKTKARGGRFAPARSSAFLKFQSVDLAGKSTLTRASKGVVEDGLLGKKKPTAALLVCTTCMVSSNRDTGRRGGGNEMKHLARSQISKRLACWKLQEEGSSARVDASAWQKWGVARRGEARREGEMTHGTKMTNAELVLLRRFLPEK